jgi:Uma2 family endonuclease
MAMPDRDDVDDILEEPPPADGFLAPVDYWTGELAMKLLPQTNGPKVEIFRGSIVVSPHAGVDHQTIARELGYHLHRAARRAGFWAYPEVNVLYREELFIPDLSVFRTSGAGRSTLDIADAVLLVEIVSGGRRRKDVIDRPTVYAEAGVPWYLRVEFRRRIPSMALYELTDREYHLVLAGAAGRTFVMTEPFGFEIDPAELLDD